MKKRHLLALLAILSLFSLKAQDLHTAPTLQIGLGGIDFTKGAFDQELVAEIIAEKQAELKTELIKTMLLRNIGVENGLFHTYIEQAIDIIAKEKDPEIRSRNLLENTVNLAFVIAYADYYVRSLDKDSADWAAFRGFFLSETADYNFFAKTDQLSLTQLTNVTVPTKNKSRLGAQTDKKCGKTDIDYGKLKRERNQQIGLYIDLVAEVVRNNPELKKLGLMRMNFAVDNAWMNNYSKLVSNKARGDLENNIERLKEDLQAHEMMIRELEKQLSHSDAISEKSYNTLMQVTTKWEHWCKSIDSSTANHRSLEYIYQYQSQPDIFHSEYELIRELSGFDSKSHDPASDWSVKYTLFRRIFRVQARAGFYSLTEMKRRNAQHIYKNLDSVLSTHLEYFSLIKMLVNKGAEITTTLEKLKEAVDDDIAAGALSAKDIVSDFDSVLGNLDISNLTDDEKKQLAQLTQFYTKLRFTKADPLSLLNEYETKIVPVVTQLGWKLPKLISLSQNTFNYLYVNIEAIGERVSLLKIDTKSAFIFLFESLDEFDEAGTFDKYLNQLSDAGDVFTNDRMKASINRVITLVRMYMKVDETDGVPNAISVDVDGFLTALQQIPYNKYRPFEFHFTLGTNMMSFSDKLSLPDNSQIKSYAFMSEKIGLKIKLWDAAYLGSFSYGDEYTYWGRTYVRTAPAADPLISNFHLLVYGSGILYNVVNTGTTAGFNYPLAGIGTGFTFFNDLDVNFSIGRPVSPDHKFMSNQLPVYHNFGFDIQFSEYLNRLNKKRKANQTQKLLADAKKEAPTTTIPNNLGISQ